MKNIIEGHSASKDSSWLPALSDASIHVFTFFEVTLTEWRPCVGTFIISIFLVSYYYHIICVKLTCLHDSK